MWIELEQVTDQCGSLPSQANLQFVYTASPYNPANFHDKSSKPLHFPPPTTWIYKVYPIQSLLHHRQVHIFTQFYFSFLHSLTGCLAAVPRNSFQRKRSGLEDSSASRTVVRRKNIVPSFDLISDDEPSGAGATAPLPQHLPVQPDTTLAAALQVHAGHADKAAYYASLLLPVDFEPRPIMPTSAFSPPPLDHLDIAKLFETDEAGDLHVDYVGVVDLFYPLVHPNCDEYTVDPDTGRRTLHSFVNLAVLPDVFLADDTVRRVLDLMP